MQIGGKLANRRRRGRRTKGGGFGVCKYCYNPAVKHQGLCTECANRPREENKFLLKCLFVQEALDSLLEQSNISKKNVQFLQKLIDFPDDGIRSFVEIILEISQVAPRKKKRFRKIKRENRPLWEKIKAHQAFAWMYEDDHFQTYGSEFDWPDELLEELYEQHAAMADSERPVR